MAVYASGLELLQPLLGPDASADDIAAALVRATYAAVNSTWSASAAGVNIDGAAALADAEVLSEIICGSAAAATPVARRRAARRLSEAVDTASAAPAALAPRAAAMPAEELKPLCDGVARVRARGAAAVAPLPPASIALAPRLLEW